MNWTRIAGTSAFGLGLGLLAGAAEAGTARAGPSVAPPASALASSAPLDGTRRIEFEQTDGRITLHTGEVEVRRLLEVVSRRAGVSLVTSPRVHGTIIADFERVPVEDLLRAVLKMADLVEQVDGGIHFIHTRDELAGAVRSTPVAEQPRTSSGPPGPRQSVLGRLLGFKGGNGARLDVAEAPRSEPIPASAARPVVVAAASAAPAAPPVLLNVGSQIEAMSLGRLSPEPPIWTPAPAPKPRTDPAVATAGFQVESSAPPSKAAARRHDTRAGETFETVAQAYYGSSRFAKALWWANRTSVAWPAALAAGKRIVIPPVEDLNPKLVAGPKRVAARPSAPGPTTLPTLERITTHARSTPRSDPQFQPASLTRPADDRRAVEGGVAVYVVRPGDTIRGIAVACFGDDSRAVEIADLNRESLQAEGRPRVGQRLILPAGATSP